VYIKYEIEDKALMDDFDIYIKKLFPQAIIEHERSDSKNDYLKSIEVLEALQDPWIFYSPNNDHPLLISIITDIEYIEELIKYAESLMSTLPYTSIIYSHLSEYLQASIPTSANHRYFGKDTIFLNQTADAVTFLRPEGDFNSIQILHIDTMKKIFTSTNRTDSPIRRLEDVNDVILPNHAIVVPTKKLCAHFDGYEHMQGTINEIVSDIEPVLFIPPGFFDKKIKIAYGYDEHKNGFVNINPCAKYFSFRDKKYGTDLKISLDEIPLFWKNHITEIDINPTICNKELIDCSKKHFQKVINPWGIFNRGFNLQNFIFQAKLHSRPFLQNYGLMPFIKRIQAKFIRSNL